MAFDAKDSRDRPALGLGPDPRPTAREHARRNRRDVRCASLGSTSPRARLRAALDSVLVSEEEDLAGGVLSSCSRRVQRDRASRGTRIRKIARVPSRSPTAPRERTRGAWCGSSRRATRRASAETPRPRRRRVEPLARANASSNRRIELQVPQNVAAAPCRSRFDPDRDVRRQRRRAACDNPRRGSMAKRPRRKRTRILLRDITSETIDRYLANAADTVKAVEQQLESSFKPPASSLSLRIQAR